MTQRLNNQTQNFYEAHGDTVRERLLDALKVDLLGPEAQDEVLSQSPGTRYLVGMLAPIGTKLSPSEDDDSSSAVDSDDEQEQGPRVSQQLVPSSIGLSFVVDDECESVSVRATWGRYEKSERGVEIDAEEAADIDPDDDPDSTATKKHKESIWSRIPFDVTTDVPLSERKGSEEIEDGVSIEWIVDLLGNLRVVSMFMVNTSTAAADRTPSPEDWLYQPHLSVSGNGPVFLSRQLPRKSPDIDPDVASADLVYRSRREFAAGHGVAADWDTEEQDAERATRIYTAVIPSREIHTVRGPLGLPGLSMDELGSATSLEQVRHILEPLLDAYGRWIENNKLEVDSIPTPDDQVAYDHIAAQEQSLGRMRSGLEALGDSDAFQAFRFMNRAMAMQRRASVRVLNRRRDETVPADDQIEASWRPFQIGFILQAIASLVDPTHLDRDVAELLWYPTGGGKTEAYLGLTALAFAIRRLRPADERYDPRAGTAVLMRYTLRLLTIQQFQRALTLICACEMLRLGNVGKWGEERFTIGLWVGQSVTPNNFEDSERALDALVNGQRRERRSPYQVLYCPWCGEDIPPGSYVAEGGLQRTLIKCPSRECPFGARNSEFGLPALVVDQEIYHHPPSLILATVDKFAQMAWNGRIRALFGRVDRYCPRHGYLVKGDRHPKRHQATRAHGAVVVQELDSPFAPPDLIIQDELHLISGPLGSLVGIYESVIDGLSTRIYEENMIRPKIVASTATVRRASKHIKGLFDRSADIFPPLGIDASNSFFAVENSEVPGRLYVGIFGPGKSIKTTLVRAYGSLLSRARYEFDRIAEADPKSQEVDVADAYMTLVGYFNSLRELGGVRRLLDDDVPARLRVLLRRGFGPNRRLFEKDRELTSRRPSSEISNTLKALDRTFKSVESGSYPIDVLLASNMISVGVDIDRLGLMVVSAQPKTSAEYIQATSRVGRRHPGLIVEVYNWVRPRDISHYEHFVHYHDTFYRHVEATSVTPFSERARDRALRGVLTSFIRQDLPEMGLPENAADGFDRAADRVDEIVGFLRDRSYRVTDDVETADETRQMLDNLTGEWHNWAHRDETLVYSIRGLSAADRRNRSTKTVLMRAMEQESGLGAWPVAGSLREVEEEIDVILLQDEED